MQVTSTSVPEEEVSANQPLNLESLSKALAFSAICFYITSLLTVNTYLYPLGVSDFSLLKPRFIYTGALVVVSITFSFLIPAYGCWMLQSTLTKNKRSEIATIIQQINYPHYSRLSLWLVVLQKCSARVRGIFQIIRKLWQPTRWPDLIIFIISLVFPWVLFLFPLIEWGEGDFTTSASPALWLYALSFLVGLFTFFSVNPRQPDLRSSSTPEWIGLFLVSSLLIYFLIVYLDFFSQYVYPSVPEQFGGGRPKQAQFLFAPEAINGVKQLGISVPDPEHPNSKELSTSVDILFEGNEVYVVHLPEKVVQISKETECPLQRMISTIQGVWCLQPERIIQVNKSIVRGVELVTEPK